MAKEQLKEKLANIIHSEEFEDACHYHPETGEPCKMWHLSAEFCKDQKYNECPKINMVIPAVSEFLKEQLEKYLEQYSEDDVMEPYRIGISNGFAKFIISELEKVI